MKTGNAVLKSLGLIVVYWIHGAALVSGQTIVSDHVVSDQSGPDQSGSDRARSDATSRIGSRKANAILASVVPASTVRAVPSHRPPANATRTEAVADAAVEPAVEPVVDGPAARGDVEVAEATRPVPVRRAPVSAALSSSSPRPKTTPTALLRPESSSRSSLAAPSESGSVAHPIALPPERKENPTGEQARRERKPVPSQGMRGSNFVHRWKVPETLSPGTAEVKWPDWLFSGANLYMDEPPPYAGIGALPLFYVYPPRETELMRKMKKVVRKKLYREVRRHVKRQWRKLFKNDPTMRASTYEETLAKINHIGKGGDRVDEFNEDYRTNEAKDQVFRRESRRGEPELPLFTWGPLTVTDAGSVRFDMGTAAATNADDIVVEKVDVGEKIAKPIFSGKEYKLHTSLNVNLNEDYSGGDNYVPFLKSYGMDVEVEWLSDILGREMVGAEFEVEYDDDGEVAAFLNFVINSR